MIKEIHAKSILGTVKNSGEWFGIRYNMNIYRGCQHGCIYCDSRSECYHIENFNDILVKVNAVSLLKSELHKKRKKGTIGTGAMSDPYIPIEKEYNLTGRALQVISDFRYPVLIATKSNLVLRDIDVLQEINRVYACVAFTITTTDDFLARSVEPGAPSPSERLKAMGILSSFGISTGITMMPILPFIEDNEDNIIEIVKRAKEYGAQFIYPSFGMTLRDRQRDYYYMKLDELFPNIKGKYQKRFKNYYRCGISNYKKIKSAFYEACSKYGISTNTPSYDNKVTAIQLSFLDKERLER